MSLINDISELSNLVGSAISVTADFNGLQPSIDAAEIRYIRKALGNEQVDELAGIVTTTEKLKLKILIRKALAFYALYEFSGYASGQQTNSGLQEVTIKEKSNPGRKWVADERKAKSNDLGSVYLDQAIEYTIQNRSTLTVWAASATGQATLSLLIQSGHQLLEALPASKGSYTLYLTLLPWLKKAEARELIEITGPALITNLKARRLAGTSTPADTAILPYLQEAVANIAYNNALINLIVVQTADSGLRVLSEFDGTQNRQKLSKEEQNQYAVSVFNNCNRAKAMLKNFLDKNLADYPDYTSWTGYEASAGIDGILQVENYTTAFPLF